MSALKPLPPDKGFAFNFTPARQDKLARDAAESVFGPQVVSDLMGKYHRSTLSYDLLRADLLDYDRVHKPSIRSDPVYQLAFTSVLEDIKSEKKLIPYTTGAVPLLPDFPRQKSAGLPYKLMGIRSKQDVVDQIGLNDNRKLWHEISFGRRHQLPDVCLYARSQLTVQPKQKIRATWGYPFDVYIEEARFFYPILDYVSSSECKLPIAYGFEMALGAMEEIHAKALKLNCKYLMTDWSLFDKTIPPWLIRDAFAIIASLIDFGKVLDSEGKTWNVRSVRSEKRWKKLVDYFVETPVRTAKGERFLVTGGVPSGSCFTNLVDTIVNTIVSRYIHYQTTGEFPISEMYLGDDAVIFTNGTIDLDLMASLAEDRFGMILSRDKSFVTTRISNIHFLGYYNYYGFPFKQQDSLIASFIAPERTRKTALEAAAAALGQLYSGFDPINGRFWMKILDFIQKKYPFDPDEVLQEIRENEGRHKYLRLIGLRAQDVSWPKYSVDAYALHLLPKNGRCKPLADRKWDYHVLAQSSFLYWSDSFDDN